MVHARDGDVAQRSLRFGFEQHAGVHRPATKKKPVQLPHQRRRTTTQKNAMAAIIMLAFLYARLVPYGHRETPIASLVAAALGQAAADERWSAALLDDEKAAATLQFARPD